MKFMQRAKENEDKKRKVSEGEEEQVFDKEIMDLCRRECDRYLSTESFALCMDLRYGRMSFKGMNPEVEKLMKEKESERARKSGQVKPELEEEEEEEPADVSEQELAKVLRAFKKRKL